MDHRIFQNQLVRYIENEKMGFLHDDFSELTYVFVEDEIDFLAIEIYR